MQEEPIQPADRKNRPRSSIVLRLSFLYFGLMLVNMSIFWFASGSNQMRLIAEKATMSAQSVSFEIFRRLQPLLDRTFTGKNDPIQIFIKNKEAFVQSLRLSTGDDKLIVPSLRVFSTDLQMLLAYPADANASVSPDDLQHAYKAIQLKDLKNEIFYGVPDILRYRIDIYLPLSSTGVNDLVLTSRIPLESIQKELTSLFRLGIVMILLLLLVQMAVGIIIYRTLIKPIRHVSSAAGELSRGEFTQIEYHTRRDDEIKTLVDSFNHMSSELKVKDNTIRQNMASIKKKNDIAQFELNIAQKIQSSIMPVAKKVGHITWTVDYQPLYTVSGDYYDILRLSDGSVAIFIGDASGHGVPAAFLTIMAKIYFSSLVEKISDPAELLRQISVLMAAYLEMEGLYMTGFYLRIYPDNRAEYCNCIHPTPLVLRKQTGELEQLPSTGFYIGILDDDRKNTTRTLQLNPGDRLILYSDGITEAKNTKKKMFSVERLAGIVREHTGASPDELKKILIDALTEFRGDVALNDDLTILIAEVGEPVAAENSAPPADEPASDITGDVSAADPIEQAIGLYHEKRFAEAIEGFREIAGADRQNQAAILLLAESFFSLKKYAEALENYERYMALSNVTDFRVLFRMASCQAHLGRFDRAEEIALKSVNIWPENPDAAAQLALMQIKCGKYAEALVQIRQALQMNPESARYRRVLNLIESRDSVEN